MFLDEIVSKASHVEKIKTLPYAGGECEQVRGNTPLGICWVSVCHDPLCVQPLR